MKLKSVLFAGAFAVAIQLLSAGSTFATGVNVGTNFFDANGNPAAAPTGAISITETFDPEVGEGTYIVTNGTSLTLQAFGVSNTGTTAFLNSEFGSNSVNDNFYDFENVLTLTDFPGTGNWQTETVFSDSNLTFQDVFGNFADNVDPGEDTINWYSAVEIGLLPGDTSADDYLKFFALRLASVGLGVLGNSPTSNGNSIFFNQGVSAVPVPAALPLFGTGLAIMGFVGWRRKRKLAA